MYSNIKKEDDSVTTQTEGVSQSSYGGGGRRRRRKKYRRRQIKQYMEKVLRETRKETKQYVVMKAKDETEIDFIEEAIYDSIFDGTNKTISDRIKDYLLRAMRKGYPVPRMINAVNRLGTKKVNKVQAGLIVRTETQAIQNKTREWAYSKSDPEDKAKYFWRSIPDNRRTTICKNITNRSRKGVSMAQLKAIINDEVSKAKDRGELPKNFKSRDWTPHLNCRSTQGRRL